MDIFTPEGDLDYELAANELAQQGASVEPVAVITAAALLDIAVSLRALADTTTGPHPAGTISPTPYERERQAATPRRGPSRVYAANDWVAFPGAPETAMRVIAMGESEGAQWVLLEGQSGRVWSDTLIPADASAQPAPRRAAKAAPAVVEREALAGYDDDYEAGGDDEDGADDALVLDDSPAPKSKGKGKKKHKGLEL